jgi:uncharacterized 2Fe-2S/4Fe-4S cluster protein (DUF4445 family)
MTDRSVQLRLEPTGQRIEVPVGTPLQDVLVEHGVEFPCGGQGTCGKCRVRVLAGQLDVSQEEIEQLGEEDIEAGWRLACRGHVANDLTLELAQWETQILTDDTPIDVTPRAGWGVAIDLGTTTIAAQLLDLRTGNVLAVRSGLNPQSSYGSDIMSRVHYAVADQGEERLRSLVRQYLGSMIEELLVEAQESNKQPEGLREVVIVGNTVMHHLFCGHDISPLAHCPFRTPRLSEESYGAAELDWNLPGEPQVRFLPCLGGFIGSDVLAGVIAAGMDLSPELQVLIDLGTNGEIVAVREDRLLCAATAAGPAFEGARIEMGMRAARGAIDRVTITNNSPQRELHCHVIGADESPRGICGSGLIDTAACALELGHLAPSGRLTSKNDRLRLAGRVAIHQCDFRELQLAKGAIAAGIEILLNQLGCKVEEVTNIFLCGAFGNYLNIPNAIRLGLLPLTPEKITPMGNTALLGAKLALLSREQFDVRTADISRRVEHFSLSEDQQFMDVYVRHMTFPE